MLPNQRPEGAPAIVVELAEWEKVGPAQDPRLQGTSLVDDTSAQRLAQALRDRVDIREGYQGLEIASTSFVGRIDVGPLRIAIRPKLPAIPLTRLLRYAYGLRDILTVAETSAPTAQHGFHYLLIAMLAAEVEELLSRGLARRYVPLSENLESPRGRILVEPPRATRRFDRHGPHQTRIGVQHGLVYPLDAHRMIRVDQRVESGLDVVLRRRIGQVEIQP